MPRGINTPGRFIAGFSLIETATIPKTTIVRIPMKSRGSFSTFSGLEVLFSVFIVYIVSF
jgi:hypothetical protein